VRCPAGQASQGWHSGGAGAPPGSTKRPRQELADDLIFALSASGLLEREIFALSASGLLEREIFALWASGPLEREIVALMASGLLERDVTDTGTKAIFFASRFERSPKRKRGPAVRKSS
jgi:hypothetical protein